ncbi:hypothetical protein F9288_13110 [Sphingomonas sp. CL5.1]|uniref:dipeptidase n=1 Tax=Sphingomonas sp. CL5.1 TaxID=2653203 RepID=UPI0015821771|nr:membrane dipeptidase [Sphingomonas sp. CL5.1]QKS00453.1 hypothetical protein F9288_13110 [Sphingomonas sp. CL5.1]
MKLVDRRTMILTAGGIAVAAIAVRATAGGGDAPLGFAPDPAFLERAEHLLARYPAIDLHAHPGDTFARDAIDLSPDVRAIAAAGPMEEQAVRDMRAGRMAGGSFAAVADVEILGTRNGAMGWLREFRPGEARASYERQIRNLRKRVGEAGASIALTPADIVRLHRQGRIAALLTVEGGDFLAGDASYLDTAFADGVRAITLVHYHPNELGDNQTAPPRSGLTAFGREVVRGMDRLGMVIDVAHASEDTARGVLETSCNPVMCSHTVLASDTDRYPRFISAGLAKAIAAKGGVIGVWPSGFGAATMNDYVERIFALRRAVGPEFVALGTDMDANYKPVLTSYRQIPLLVSELLRRGYGEQETIAFAGGNFLRLFGAVWKGRSTRQS